MVNKILTNMAAMDREELLEVQRRASVLLGVSAPSPVKLSVLERELWGVVIGQLRLLRKGKAAPILGKLPSKRERKALSEASASLPAWADEAMGGGWGKAGRVKRLSLLNLFVRCMVRTLLERREPCSPASLLEALSESALIEEAIENSFPGYLSSGLLWVVAR